MDNRNVAVGSFAPPHCRALFIDTNLGTHLATLVHDGDTVSSLKEKLLQEHRLCFPDVGDIEISALKVKRRGHFYHLSDTMIVTRAFSGIGKNWFLFVEATVVEKPGENQQLQCIDSSKQIKYMTNGSEPHLHDPSRMVLRSNDLSQQMESDHQLVIFKSSGNLSGADKQQPTDFETEAEHNAGNHPDIRYPDTHASESAAYDLQIVSVAADHNNIPPELPEKEKDIAMNSETVQGHTNHEVKDVQQNLILKEATGIELSTKRKSKSKRSSGDHNVEQTHGPSDASTIAHETAESNAVKASANELEPREDATPAVIEPIVAVRENDGVKDNTIVAVRENDGVRNVQQNPNLKEATGIELSTKRKSKSKRKTRSSEDHNVEQTHGPPDASTIAHEIAESNAVKASAYELEPREDATPAVIEPIVTVRENDGVKDNSIEAGEDTIQHKNNENIIESAKPLTETSGFQTPARKKRKIEKKPGNKDSVSVSVASKSDTSKKPDAIGLQPAPVDKLNVVSLVATEMANDHMEGNSGLTTGPTVEKKKKHKKSSKDHSRSDTITTSMADHVSRSHRVDGPLTAVLEKETEKIEEGIGHAARSKEVIVSAADDLQATTPVPLVKDDSEAVAKGNDGEVRAQEAKSMKSSKAKKKSKKTKALIEDTLAVSGAQQVEGAVKAVDGEGPDSVIRNVLESLQQSKENEDNLEKVEKKSKKKTKKKRTSNVGEDPTEIVEVENGDPLLSNKNAEVANPFNQKEGFNENEKADIGDNFGSTQTEQNIVASGKKPGRVADGVRAVEPGAKSNKRKKASDLSSGGAIDGQRSSIKRAQPASSSTGQQLKNDSAVTVSLLPHKNDDNDNDDASHKMEQNSKAQVPVEPKPNSKKSKDSRENKKIRNVGRKNLFPSSGDIFKDAESSNSEGIGSKISSASTRTPSEASSDYSDDEDSDASFKTQKNGSGEGDKEANVWSSGKDAMSLEKILRSSKRYKRAKLTASQSQPDDDSLPFDYVPDSQQAL